MTETIKRPCYGCSRLMPPMRRVVGEWTGPSEHGESTWELKSCGHIGALLHSGPKPHTVADTP